MVVASEDATPQCHQRWLENPCMKKNGGWVRWENHRTIAADIFQHAMFDGIRYHRVSPEIFPTCSMVLVYLPTKLNSVNFWVNVGKYSSTMEHLAPKHVDLPGLLSPRFLQIDFPGGALVRKLDVRTGWLLGRSLVGGRYPLVNIQKAMENCPFMDGFPIKNGDFL